MRGGDPLPSKGLDVLHGMLGGIVKKLANDLDPFIVGDVDGGFVMQRLAMQVLRASSVS